MMTNDRTAEADMSALRILIATDCHLGHKGSDAIRGDDSFNAFKEVLQIARTEEVDFILLGGDLFDNGKPKLGHLYRCMSLIEKHCMTEDKMVNFELVSDQKVKFVQDEDGNSNVNRSPGKKRKRSGSNYEIPVFTIHGNHDEPQKIEDYIGSMDVLYKAGSIVYFGKHETRIKRGNTDEEDHHSMDGDSDWSDRNIESQSEVESIELTPLLFKKGQASVAIYGIGSMRDDDLRSRFEGGKIKWKQPGPGMTNCYKIFVIHQDRDKRCNRFVPEDCFADDLDLVVWGHVHDFQKTLKIVPGKKYKILQPGSTIVTSLIEGEAVKKHVVLLEITGCDNESPKIIPIPLKSVRPFGYLPMENLQHLYNKTAYIWKDNLVQHLTKKIEETITTYSETSKLLPLIRIKVDHDMIESSVFRLVERELEIKFEGKVANPNSIFAPPTKGELHQTGLTDVSAMQTANMEERILEIFEKYSEEKKLKLFQVNELNDSVRSCAHQGNKKGITTFVDEVIEAEIKEVEEGTSHQSKSLGEVIELNSDDNEAMDDNEVYTLDSD